MSFSGNHNNNKTRNDTLAVVDITPKHVKEHPRMKYDVLPQHEFSMLVIAPKGSGKTNFICNLLLNHMKGYFHAIDICSTTVDGDAKWSAVKKAKGILVENKKLKKFRSKMKGTQRAKIPEVVHKSGHKENMTGEKAFDGKLPKETFFEDIDEVVVRMDKAMEQITQLKKDLGEKNEDDAKFLADRRLVIIDDKAGCFGSGKTNPLAHKVMLHRHHNYSMILVTQQYKSIPNQIRTNTNAKILFDIPNANEVAAIYDENPACLHEDQWYSWYNYCMRIPYAFMYINDKFPKFQQVYCNFTHICTMGREEMDPISSSSDDDSDDGKRSAKKPRLIRPPKILIPRDDDDNKKMSSE